MKLRDAFAAVIIAFFATLGIVHFVHAYPLWYSDRVMYLRYELIGIVSFGVALVVFYAMVIITEAKKQKG